MKVIKRNKTIEDFDTEKIARAINKAGMSIDDARMIAKNVSDLFIEDTNVAVDDIHDAVEAELVSMNQTDVVKQYIIYRAKHKKIRKIVDDNNSKLIQNYLDSKSWDVKENANTSYSLQGLHNYVTTEASRRYWFNKIYSKDEVKAHEAGDFHISDLGFLSNYCSGHDLTDLLTVGFRGVVGKTSSKPAKHFRTALNQMTNFIFSMSGESAGAQAFSNVDTLLAPFIYYDKLSYHEVKQCMQEFIFSLNIATRVGFQYPFSNLTLDLVCPKHLAEQAVIIGGVWQDKTYGEFQNEMNMFNKAFCEVMYEGDAEGRIFSFPIPTYNITSEFNFDDPNFEPLWKMTSKYGIPYFANLVAGDIKPEDIRSMCPLSGDTKILYKSGDARVGATLVDLKGVYNTFKDRPDDFFEVYACGEYVPAKIRKYDDLDFVEVTLSNGHKVQMSTEHLNYVKKTRESSEEVLPAKELATDMFLPYSTNKYEGVGGNWELGYLVGCFAGDGSFGGSGEGSYVTYSLSVGKKEATLAKLIEIITKYFGEVCSISKFENKKLIQMRANSKAVVGLIQQFVIDKGRNKTYTGRVYSMSEDFRLGILAGHYDTDGGNNGRIYTASKSMVEALNMLYATLGTTTNVIEDNREGRLGTEVVYTVRPYSPTCTCYNTSKGMVYFTDPENNKLWFRIVDIKPISKSTGFCLEVDEAFEPQFTIGDTGIITHNCRLKIDNKSLAYKGGGLFGASPLTGSIGLTTINLPRLGYLAKDKKDFYKRLDKLLEMSYSILEKKRAFIEDQTERDLYPYTKYYLRNIKARTGKYWINHFSTLGIIGANECCLNMFGQDITAPASREFILEVMDYLRDKLITFQERSGSNWNLEATPAESVTSRLARIDSMTFKDCHYQGTLENPYYTNSTALPVNFTEDLFEYLDHQDEFQTKYTGGTVAHLFLGEQIPPESAKELVRKVCYNYKLPYISLTPTFSVCPEHGYIAGEHAECPTCNAKTEVYSRIVGYLRPINNWNASKEQEFKDRKTFNVKGE